MPEMDLIAERIGAGAGLKGRLCLRKIGPGLDPKRFLRIAGDHGCAEAFCSTHRNDVGEVLFPRGVVVRHAIDQCQHGGAIRHHHARVYQADVSFLRGCVFIFHDPH